MAKESLQGINKKPIFRETFADEATTRSLNGQPTAVTYSNGVASCVAANSSKLYYPNRPLSGVYSVRLKLKSCAFSTNGLIVDFRGATGTGAGYVIFFNATALAVSSGTLYVNGVVTTTINPSLSNDIIVTGMTIASIETFLSSRYSSTAFVSAEWELFEVYEGTLTAQEVKNLYENKRYEQIQYKLTTPEILNIDGKNGTISNKYSGSRINGNLVPNIVNTAVTSVRNDGINAMSFNGGTSKLDCGSYDTLVGDKTFVCWMKPLTYGGNAQGILYNNVKLAIFFVGNVFRLYSDGTTFCASGTIKLGSNQLFIATRSSTGVTNFYINGVLSGTANQSSGTPAAGSTNLFIGNRSDGTGAFDGTLSGVRVVSGILSVDEISQLFSNERKNYNV
jgi:hypothetical protein